METLLAEAGASGTAVTVGSLAALLAMYEGVKFGGRRWRNGNGSSKPGCTVACVDHLTRLGILEAEQKHFKEWLEKVEKKLDKVLEER